MKRIFDIGASLFGLIILSPLLIILAIIVALTSKGGAFYHQVRVGKNAINFKLWKLRTMYSDPKKQIQLTIGERDPRVTGIGFFLRKFKLDELPQLLNVLLGQMSIVGPRPEVPEYVALYTDVQQQVLNVRPGLTDPASIAYINENELLAASSDPEKTYKEEVMPAKLKMNLEYLDKRNFVSDLGLILKTFGRILS